MSGCIRNPRKNSGYTLVETLVSSVVLSLSVFMVCTMLLKGREIETKHAHFQRARAIVDSCLESRAYHVNNYDIMLGTAAQVVIDNLNGVVVTGTLSVTVSAEQTIVGDETVPVIFKEITSRVTWDELEGQESFSISKRISRF